jgi:hypothetical protein
MKLDFLLEISQRLSIIRLYASKLVNQQTGETPEDHETTRALEASIKDVTKLRDKVHKLQDQETILNNIIKSQNKSYPKGDNLSGAGPSSGAGPF